MLLFTLLLTIQLTSWTTVLASEYDLTKGETVDIEILFPKQENPINTVPGTPDERAKSNTLVSFIDRLLNRNPTNSQAASSVANSGTVNNNNNLGAALLATTKRSLLSSLIFIPDVNKGVDTILSGVASGNLEQIISGSFIFTPNRVQSVASTVINRVFGGQSISQINQNNIASNNNATQTQSGVVQQQQQQQQANSVNNGQQQGQVLTNNNNNNNLGQQLQSAPNLPQQQPQQQQQQNLQSLLNNFGQKQQQQTGNINPANNNNIQNLITGVLGQLLPNTAQSLQ